MRQLFNDTEADQLWLSPAPRRRGQHAGDERGTAARAVPRRAQGAASRAGGARALGLGGASRADSRHRLRERRRALGARRRRRSARGWRSSTAPWSTSPCRTSARDLDASTSALQWILNGYLLTLASLILLGGSLGDRYGRRRVFVIGVGLFTAASLLCAIAPSVELLIAARLLQGVGGALLTPGQPGDDRGQLPARRPRPGDRRLVGARRRRDRDRAAARRLPDRGASPGGRSS